MPNHDEVVASITRWPYRIGVERQYILSMMRGDPIPASRPRFANGRAYIPRSNTKYRDDLGWTFKKGLQQGRIAEVDNETRFGVRAFFYRRTAQRIDVDNLLKVCHDAGTGVIWADDSQVVETFGRVFFSSPNPRVIILIYRVQPAPFEHPTYKCEECGKVAPVSPSQRRRFCSRACRIKNWRRISHLERTCEECSALFSVPRSVVKSGRMGRFCSKKCASRTFGRLRKTVGSDLWRCCDCGGRVSRKEYIRCQPCETLRRQTPTSNYRLVKLL